MEALALHVPYSGTQWFVVHSASAGEKFQDLSDFWTLACGV